MTLVCSLFAWMKYRYIIQQYGVHTDRVNLVTQKESTDFRIALHEKRLAAADGRLDVRQIEDIRTTIRYLEAEKAIYELELAGFDVSHQGRTRSQISIRAGRRSLTHEQVIDFLAHLKTIRKASYYSIDVIDLEGTKTRDIEGVVSSVESVCPECKVRR